MLDFLRSIPYFAGANPGQLERLARASIERGFTQSDILFTEGERCAGLYVVKSGLVRVFKTSAEGKEQVLLLAGPGESFNDVSVFDGGPNPASADALQSTTVCIIPTGILLAFVQESPAAALSIIKVFALRLRHLTGLIEDLSFRTVTVRVAKILLQLAQTEGVPRQLTQQQMAAMAGTAREMVGRALKALEEQGAIRVEGRRILVLKPALLRDML